MINYKKTQKTVVRVSPHSPLQELIPVICSKCEFDPSHTLLLKSYQSQEPLDMTKSLNDLGLRELYAMAVTQGKITFVNCCYIKGNCLIVAYMLLGFLLRKIFSRNLIYISLIFH